jgi:hypothetical protein
MKWPRPGWFWQAAPLALIALFVEALVLVIWAYLASHPAVVVPPENRHAFARVAILMDGTQSTHPRVTYPLIKRIVQTKIIPSLGLNDVAVAYDVRGTFSPAGNAVFGVLDDQLPQEPDGRQAEILDVLESTRAGTGRDGEIHDLIRALAPYRHPIELVRDAWTRQVARREVPTHAGSDLCSPLRELGELLRGGDPGAERWLFVLSDLQNTGPPQSCHPDEAFPSARILLIYPFDPNHPSWPVIEGFWRGFFGNRKLERVSLTPALTAQNLLPPNPAAGLDGYAAPPTAWECARPWLLPALGLVLLILAIGSFFPHGSPSGSSLMK